MNQPAWQSEPTYDGTSYATKAVDGDVTDNWPRHYACAMTGKPYNNGPAMHHWWMVDLEDVYEIHRIVLSPRPKDQKGTTLRKLKICSSSIVSIY